MLSTIAKPFGWLLMALYELTKNYGICLLYTSVPPVQQAPQVSLAQVLLRLQISYQILSILRAI